MTVGGTDSAPPQAGTSARPVAFNRPALDEDSAAAVSSVVRSGAVKAGGEWTERSTVRLAGHLRGRVPLLVQSCTAALELAALLLRVGPGDEVVMPSFTFASSATAFVLRGATPVFVDVDPATMNLDPAAVAAAITPRTRAVLAMHYAGVACDLDALLTTTRAAGIPLIEDAAHAIGASWKERPLGTIGALGTFSFDATKNITCGSGGAFVAGDPTLVAAAEILRDYGTDRARFTRREVSHYRWLEAGSNLALNEIAAACLYPQLGRVEAVTERRRELWARYHAALAGAEAEGRVRRPTVPAGAAHNGHIYWVILPPGLDRAEVIATLAARGFEAASHYVPLHSAPAGERHGRVAGELGHTEDLAARLLRLPLHTGMRDADADAVATALDGIVRSVVASR